MLHFRGKPGPARNSGWVGEQGEGERGAFERGNQERG